MYTGGKPAGGIVGEDKLILAQRLPPVAVEGGNKRVGDAPVVQPYLIGHIREQPVGRRIACANTFEYFLLQEYPVGNHFGKALPSMQANPRQGGSPDGGKVGSLNPFGA